MCGIVWSYSHNHLTLQQPEPLAFSGEHVHLAFLALVYHQLMSWHHFIHQTVHHMQANGRTEHFKREEIRELPDDVLDLIFETIITDSTLDWSAEVQAWRCQKVSRSAPQMPTLATTSSSATDGHR